MTVPVCVPPAVPVEGHVAGREAGDGLAEHDREVDRAGAVGSGWAAAWLMVTVGGVLSTTIAPARVNSALCPAKQASTL